MGNVKERRIHRGTMTERLHQATIEKVFTDSVLDLGQVIMLDGIDTLPDSSGFRIRSHDLHGSLPEIVVKNSSDTFVDKERLANQACKLIAIVKLRDQMTRWLPGGKFLPPAISDKQATVGFKVALRAWLAIGEDSLWHITNCACAGDSMKGDRHKPTARQNDANFEVVGPLQPKPSHGA